MQDPAATTIRGGLHYAVKHAAPKAAPWAIDRVVELHLEGLRCDRGIVAQLAATATEFTRLKARTDHRRELLPG